MDKIISLFEKYYYRVYGLFIGYVILYLVFVTSNNSLIVLITNWEPRFFIYLCLYICWTVFWFLSRIYFPRTSRNKIGLILAISAENEKQKIRVKSDFAEQLSRSLRENNLSPYFDLLLLSEYRTLRAIQIINEYNDQLRDVRAKKNGIINNLKLPSEIKKFNRFKKRVRGQLYIWGSIKERFDIENKYFINIDTLVTHKPIPLDKSKNVRNDILAIFPKEISFNEKFEVKGFQLATRHIYIATRFITGIAAFISGDPETAITLHHGLKDEIEKFADPLPPNFSYVLNRLKQLISAEKYLIARYIYLTKKDVEKAKKIIAECLVNSSYQYDFLILSSMIAFKEDRDPIKSLKLLNRASKIAKENYTWLYNKAFLLMYLGKFDKGIKLYKRLNKISFSGEEIVINQCIDFNKEIIENEPDKIQSLFILGYLFYNKILNFPLALEYFEKFKEKANKKMGYDYLVSCTNSYLSEIYSQMKIKSRNKKL